MTPMKLARRAVRLFNNDMVPKSTNRHNQRSWIAAVTSLGDKWLFNIRVDKLEIK